MPESAAVVSTPAKLLCFNDYVMRQKGRRREAEKGTVGRKRQQERGRDSCGFSEERDNRDAERC